MQYKLAIVLPVIALACAALYLSAPTTTDAPADFTVQYGSQAPWIETYVDGVLTGEWHPRDGETYWLLMDMIEQRRGEPLMLARASGEAISAF